jgi:hypothetical protein
MSLSSLSGLLGAKAALGEGPVLSFSSFLIRIEEKQEQRAKKHGGCYRRSSMYFLTIGAQGVSLKI